MGWRSNGSIDEEPYKIQEHQILRGDNPAAARDQASRIRRTPWTRGDWDHEEHLASVDSFPSHIPSSPIGSKFTGNRALHPISSKVTAVLRLSLHPIVSSSPASVAMADFALCKEQRLGSGADASRKGRVDAPIVELLQLVNGSERYCSTSSCSGRLLLLGGTDQTEGQKRNCPWLFVTHQKCRKEDVVSGLQKAEDNAVFKFEPFVLHVQCRQVEDAQLLAVRSTHCLEVPLCHRGSVLVSDKYIDYLVQVANRKMEENQRRIERFHASLQALIASTVPPQEPSGVTGNAATVYTRRRRQGATTGQRQHREPTDQSDDESDLGILMDPT
ncbi:tRNA wybutosine-synthesizing protein 3 homolog isoform X3 [Hypanus sabinus]|uniref:tRNA wybutosine-synthesizing protein 3 homolog isoform X3 n=1 Tax=Hypanus sabinus TaxID=79690 RepID=UPI0028C3DE1F|nr:tRNA wybutosine-synthesizing protein 3 homolog isoform X3 [Hypanus sabinus]